MCYRVGIHLRNTGKFCNLFVNCLNKCRFTSKKEFFFAGSTGRSLMTHVIKWLLKNAVVSLYKLQSSRYKSWKWISLKYQVYVRDTNILESYIVINYVIVSVFLWRYVIFVKINVLINVVVGSMTLNQSLKRLNKIKKNILFAWLWTTGSFLKEKVLGGKFSYVNMLCFSFILQMLFKVMWAFYKLF